MNTNKKRISTMNTNVISSLFAVLMAILFGGCIRINFNNDGSDSQESGSKGISEYTFSDYNDADFVLGGDTVAATVSEFNVDWFDGDVCLQAYDGDKVVFYEEAHGQLDSATTMRHYLDPQGSLTICFCKPGKLSPIKVSKLHKKLTVLIPKGMLLQDVDVNGISTDILVEGLSAEKMNVKTVSGDIHHRGVSSLKNEVETVSGDIHVRSLNGADLDVESISGDIHLASLDVREVEANTVSGDVTLSTHGKGWEVTAESVSGDVNCEPQSTKKHDRYTIGDGTRKAELNAISGDVTIK